LISCFLEEEKKRSLSLMKDADAIFMKGGGVLQTYGGVTSTYSMYFWVYPILLAHKLKKPVYIMPNSFGPFEGPFVKCIARFALKKCRVVTSRESYSQKTIKEQLGLDIENYPDLAFELPKSNLDKVSIFEKYKLPNDKKLVAITMRPYRFPTCTNPKQAYETFKNEMAAFIEELYTNGFMPVIIEHTMAVNDHENDGACIRDVIKKIDKEKYRFITDTTFDCYDLKCIYSFCDYIVGTRFHSVIFSLGSGVPGIAISYIGNKSTGIMHDIGLDDYVIDIADVTCERLITKLKNLVQEQDIVMSKINAYRTLSQQKRRILVDSLKDK
jgi:colanic acid/amylovoran biosynthesis protein